MSQYDGVQRLVGSLQKVAKPEEPHGLMQGVAMGFDHFAWYRIGEMIEHHAARAPL